MITIDDPRLEAHIRALFGDDQQAFQAWLEDELNGFERAERLGGGIQQFENGRYRSADEVLGALKARYADKHWGRLHRAGGKAVAGAGAVAV